MNIHKGFTLIELMVVIAIIGILSAVVLAMLSTPRSKGGDSAVKANLKSILTQSQLYYGDNGNKYNTDGVLIPAPTNCPTIGGSMFATDQTIKNAIAAANTAGGGPVTCYMNAVGSAYVVWAPMKTAGTYWCIDSTGTGKQKPAAQGVGDLSC